MAVSLSDAWNDTIDPPSRPTVPIQPVVSAKLTESTVIDEETRRAAADRSRHLEYLEELLVHFNELRKEEAKRSTVYIVMAAILFALLFVYIDRLQNKLRILSNIIASTHRWQGPPEMKSMSQGPMQWYS